AKDKVTSLDNTNAGYEASLANLTSQATLLANNSTYDAAAKEAAINSANQQLATAKAQLEAAQAKLTEAESQRDAVKARISALESTLGEGSKELADAKADEARAAMDKAKIVMDQAKAKWDNDPDGTCKVDELQGGEKEMFQGMDGMKWEMVYTLKKDLYDQASAAYNSFQAIADNYMANEAQLIKAKQSLSSAEQQIKNCNSDIANQETNIANINTTIASLNAGTTSTDIAAQQKSIADQKAQLTASIAKIETEIAAAREAQTQVLTDVAGELNLGSQNAEIARAREKVNEKKQEIAKLEEEQNNPVVTAPVSGKITSLSYVAGETTRPGENAAVIQVAGKGFSLSFSVTNEQAKKVSAGDVAELQNSWYYNDVQATVSAIKPDTTNPSQNKLLVFDVTGEDVTAGQSLSLSVGQKSANYDLIVPNSAIREDNNGKFILIVESKSSPLGNRYFATRVDVEVLASDDTQTAISGALYGYEYVITTATKPVEAGKQVRLTD
ncbi:MAG: HlyD family efflux transporter periplasmic adaptor subunit, partial [Lachnospiraceae bacterium]|nr:HlyD family efflux transporter periplasmic adaptor subunit [Lachnospiraceae bacterium]